MGSAIKGREPQQSTYVPPPLRPPMYGSANWVGNQLPSLWGQPLPSYKGSLDPGLAPTLDQGIRFLRDRATSAGPSILGNAQGTLGALMNPGQSGLRNPFSMSSFTGGGSVMSPENIQSSRDALMRYQNPMYQLPVPRLGLGAPAPFQPPPPKGTITSTPLGGGGAAPSPTPPTGTIGATPMGGGGTPPPAAPPGGPAGNLWDWTRSLGTGGGISDRMIRFPLLWPANAAQGQVSGLAGSFGGGGGISDRMMRFPQASQGQPGGGFLPLLQQLQQRAQGGNAATGSVSGLASSFMQAQQGPSWYR